MGDSAGGHVALVTLQFVKNYRERLSDELGWQVPMPAYVACFSAWGDMELHLESVALNADADYLKKPAPDALSVSNVLAFGRYGFDHRNDGQLTREH